MAILNNLNYSKTGTQNQTCSTSQQILSDNCSTFDNNDELALNNNEVKQDWRAEQSLSSQIELAKWAMPMFWIGLISSLVSAFGVLLLMATLYETKEAGIKLADQNRIAKNTSRRQLRPYVYVAAPNIKINAAPTKKNHIDVILDFEVQNSGLTPAYEMETTILVFVSKNGTQTPEHKLSQKPLNRHSQLHKKVHLNFNDTIDVSAINNGGTYLPGSHLHVFIFARYHDIYGIELRNSQDKFFDLYAFKVKLPLSTNKMKTDYIKEQNKRTV